MSDVIQDYPVHHAGIRPVMHPGLGVTVNGQTAVRYLRFLRPVRLDRLELPHSVYARWVPMVPTHPAHVIISVLDHKTFRWQTLKEVELPSNERIQGKGLTQKMPIEKMDAFFEAVLREPPYRIPLDGLTSDHLRVECDREHPVWPNHGECNGGPFNVPFGILHPLKVYGKPRGAVPDPSPLPILRQGTIRPVAPRGMRFIRQPHMVRFVGDRLSVGFSLVRPMLTHLGWDAQDGDLAGVNRLKACRMGRAMFDDIGGLSGPLVRTLSQDGPAHLWTGGVSLSGNRVRYEGLRFLDGLTMDAEFTVHPERLVVELVQTCDRDLPVLEAEAWRCTWNMQAGGITGTMAEPTLQPGRNGAVHLPLFFVGSGNGCLRCRLLEGNLEQLHFQTESYQRYACRTAGLALAPFPALGSPIVLPVGVRRAALELTLANVEPARPKTAPALTPGLRRCWASIFTSFRPEFAGFSNNAISTNCHVNQFVCPDLVMFTRKPKDGPDPVALVRFGIERAILDGGGYGYHRGLYLDADPVLVAAAGRLHQFAPDRVWLERVRPGLAAAVRRMLGNMGKAGLVMCRALSGNSGSYRWSSNAMDVVGFGHLDAYVNAWCYRGLRNAAALCTAWGDRALSTRAREAAESIRASYAKEFINPETGWVAGWRSRDGALHDFAFIWINGVACAFGVLKPAVARKALHNLEALRDKVGPSMGGYMGLPLNLLPIHRRDHMLAKIAPGTTPTFETYTDGSLCACVNGYYLRALSIHGLKDRARQLAAELDAGYADGQFHGRYGLDGTEFHTWDGLESGYEGTFGPSFMPLYAIAVEKGIIRPPEPEWWPGEG